MAEPGLNLQNLHILSTSLDGPDTTTIFVQHRFSVPSVRFMWLAAWFRKENTHDAFSPIARDGPRWSAIKTSSSHWKIGWHTRPVFPAFRCVSRVLACSVTKDGDSLQTKDLVITKDSVSATYPARCLRTFYGKHTTSALSSADRDLAFAARNMAYSPDENDMSLSLESKNAHRSRLFWPHYRQQPETIVDHRAQFT